MRFNKGVHKFRPAQSEQALPTAGGHITSFSGKYRCAASRAASHSDWLSLFRICCVIGVQYTSNLDFLYSLVVCVYIVCG